MSAKYLNKYRENAKHKTEKINDKEKSYFEVKNSEIKESFNFQMKKVLHITGRN